MLNLQEDGARGQADAVEPTWEEVQTGGYREARGRLVGYQQARRSHMLSNADSENYTASDLEMMQLSRPNNLFSEQCRVLSPSSQQDSYQHRDHPNVPKQPI